MFNKRKRQRRELDILYQIIQIQDKYGITNRDLQYLKTLFIADIFNI